MVSPDIAKRLKEIQQELFPQISERLTTKEDIIQMNFLINRTIFYLVKHYNLDPNARYLTYEEAQRT